MKKLRSIFISLLTALSLSLAHNMGSNSSALAQNAIQSLGSKAEVEEIVRDYILNNPEVILEALERLEQQRLAEQENLQKQLIAENADILLNSEHQSIMGNPDGDVTLIEFFDYNCGFCRQSHEHVERLIEEDRNLRIVLKEFPVLGPGSQEAARVSIAASKVDPEKYLKLHAALLQSRGQVDGRIAMRLTEQLGFDMDAIEATLGQRLIEDNFSEVYTIAQQLGLSGTPTFIIGSEILPGAVGYDVLKEKIEAMRECGQSICS